MVMELSCGALLRGLLVGGRPGERKRSSSRRWSQVSMARQDVGDVRTGIDAGGVGGGDQRQRIGEAIVAGLGSCEKCRP